MICGTKQVGKLIMMDCIMWTKMETKVIFYCFLKMPGDIVTIIFGVCITKMNTFIFLLPALLGGLTLGPQRNLLAPRTPPGTPRRPTDEARHKQRRQALGLANGAQRSDDDDEEEKENQQNPKEGNSLLDNLLSRLLNKWEKAIDQLEEQILTDLKDFKLRLGIRP
ncbi:E4 [human papillomavirus 129]|uniref:E4 n=1 Tax=human papillomavirus 129 TaxID=931210 RepID=E7BRR8_9PAPI|nr:E4 [human papillomavirus 129]ADR77931.1 E4 [human papillomavirus 129]